VSGIATGYFTATYVSEIDGSTQPFAVWIPRSYTARKKYPLLVVLHGSDADERMIPEQCLRVAERGYREDLIVLSPFGRGDVDFRWMGEADLWDTMNWVKSRYSVDRRRQYLTGLSMGAYATWRLAIDYPEQWAAIAPVCGGGDVRQLSRLKRTPVWCVHGEDDDVVPVESSRVMAAELNRLGGQCRYTELKGWGHHSWEWLYNPDAADGGLPAWLLPHRLDAPAPILRRPKRRGVFMDLFGEPLVISYATGTLLGRESDLLRREADRLASFTFGDLAMRSGKLIVKPDTEVTPADLRTKNQLMIGRADNHRWLKTATRRLQARHRQGVLTVGQETYLGKNLLALTCQPSPWKPGRLLGIATYQQYQQARWLAHATLDYPSSLRRLNVFDTQAKRLIRADE
jgi:pimeloyl-ACP methyl ester carboxylesterase